MDLDINCITKFSPQKLSLIRKVYLYMYMSIIYLVNVYTFIIILSIFRYRIMHILSNAADPILFLIFFMNVFVLFCIFAIYPAVYTGSILASILDTCRAS